jgi:hypothetical protein
MSARTETIRSEVSRLIHQTPFRPFSLNMENGDRIIVDHPENIAFDPPNDKSSGSEDFYVLSTRLRIFGTFGAVSSVALADAGA